MILCVTLNPCLDKTLTVPAWQPGDSVRGRTTREVVGGKGNNVARALTRLGRAARPVTFLGGPLAEHCQHLLRRDDGLDPLAISTEAPTRVILTVRTEHSPAQTAFFDPDPAIAPAEADALFRSVEASLNAGAVEALTLSGSSPAATTHGLFSDLIALARSRKVPVLLDTYGPALDAIWGFWPDVLQVNRREAAGHLRRPDPPEADLFSLLDDWVRRGVECAVVTSGPDAVLVRWRNQRWRVRPPAIAPINPIGSGDCLLAGLADARLDRRDPEDALRHAVACAVANALVWDAGAIDPDAVARLRDQVTVEHVG